MSPCYSYQSYNILPSNYWQNYTSKYILQFSAYISQSAFFVVPPTTNLEFSSFASNAIQISRLFSSTPFRTLSLLVTACFHSFPSRSLATCHFFRLPNSASSRPHFLPEPRKNLQKLPKLSNIYALQFLIDFFDPRCFHLDFEYFSASQFLAYSFLYKYSDAFTCH